VCTITIRYKRIYLLIAV